MEIKLNIYKAGTSPSQNDLRCKVNKWTFSDRYMGEQYVTFDIESPTVIEWEVGDYCVFRGQSYTLNYIPSCTQNARIGESGKSFVYNNIKFNSFADELTRCIILDVVPTTGEYDQYAGTNYTGSAVFTLYCGETIWNNHVYAPVHALADRIWSNLIRLYPDAGWEIYVNDEACKSDDAIISFNNWTASQALAEVHNTFKCDYSIIGRKIYIGYSMPELTSTRTEPIGDESDEESDDSSMFFFGYGKGYPTISNGGGTALFEIKRTANSEQNIITRLRAYGSTKNLPYRYYSNKYGLPQTMYVNHLQLPDTFKPYDENSDPEGHYTGNYKTTGNAARDASEHDSDGNPLLRHVLGETNDAYIDKNDDAASCAEGIREGVGAWDGSDSNLEEIYPTIQGTTYADLRGNNVPDKSNQTGPNSYQTTAVYANEERVDEVLGVNEDCNIGDGTISLDSWSGREETLDAARELSSYTWVYGTSPQSSAFSGAGEVLLAETSSEQYPGDYVLSGTFDSVVMRTYFGYSGSPTSGSTSVITYNVGYRLRVVQHASDNGEDTELISYTTPMTTVTGSRTNAVMTDVLFVNLPDAINAAIEDESQQIKGIHVSETSSIRIYFKPIAQIVTTITSANAGNGLFFNYEIVSNKENVEPHLIWGPYSGEKFLEDETFHIYLKDLGFDLEEYQDKKVEDGEVQISMTSGNCVGRTFDLVSVEDYTDEATGKKGWKVELSRYKDDTLNIYYPNDHNIIASGDRFVILNIELPDSYIKAAELRLLRAATAYLADNCETKYTYEPSVNDIYLQQNIDRCEGSGHIENSIFWKLYAGLKFPFRGIPESNDELDPLPFLDITISQVEIRMGEKLTPQVSLQLNDDIEQSTIKKLTTAVDRLYNSVAVGGGGGMSLSAFNELLRTEGTKRFLSRIKDDTAAGTITFQKKSIHSQGAAFGNGGEIDENGDASLRNISADGNVSVTGTDGNTTDLAVAPNTSRDKKAATFGETTDSLLDGVGTLITEDGRVQTTKMEVRGTLTVLDLIASQIHSLDGYYYFSDTMKIETVTEVLMSTHYDGVAGEDIYKYWKSYEDYVAYCQQHGEEASAESELPIRYLLTFEKEYENDFLKFYNEDVLLSIRTDLESESERETTEGGNTGLHDITAWSWMSVAQNSEQNKTLAIWDEIADGGLRPDESSSLCALVSLYDDVQSNTPPEAGYYITRRGNRVTETSSTDYKPERQNSWCISVEEGRLTYYINQTSPVTSDENYGIAIGKLPDILPVRSLGLEGEIGIYTKYMLAQHMININWAGDVKYVTIDMGEWNAASAQNHEYFYSKTYEEGTTVYTRVQVTHNGQVWQSIANLASGNVDDRQDIMTAPYLGHTNWVHISGQLNEVFYYTTSETKDLDEGGVSMGSDEPYWLTDQSFFLQEYLDESDTEENPWFYCAFRPFMWRKSHRVVGNDSEHYSILENPHIIGVYGETGEVIMADIDDEMTTVGIDSDGILQTDSPIVITTHAQIWRGETALPIAMTGVIDGQTVTLTHLVGDVPADMSITLAVNSQDATILDITIELQNGLDFNTYSSYILKFRITGQDDGEYFNRFVIHEVKGNRDASDGLVYTLIPDVNAVHKSADGTLSDNNIPVHCYTMVGGVRTEVLSPNVWLYYNGSTTPTQYNNTSKVAINSSTITVTAAWYPVAWTPSTGSANAAYDRETIIVVSDGADGTSAPSYHTFKYGWSANASGSPSDVSLWSDSIPPTVSGKPYLWLQDSYYQLVNSSYGAPTVTYARLNGDNGTSFVPKGSFTQADWSGYASIQAYLTAVHSNPSVGDAYIYQLDGHLWLWNGQEWRDVGQIKGDPGVDAIRVDLDNENDTMLYDGSGNLCSGSVVSHATLYDGNTAYTTTGVTWSINAPSGSAVSGCSAIISGNQVTVSSMSANTGFVYVRALYNGLYYYSMLTLKRIVDADRYDIIVDPNSVSYNITTGSPASTEIHVNVYKTTCTGVRTSLTSLPSGYGLFYYVNQSSTATAISTYDSTNNYWKFTTGNERASRYRVVLSSNGNVIDSETIPINKCSNGAKGDDGDDGLSGAITRVFQDEFRHNADYYAGETIQGSSVRYQDYVAVPNENVTSGFLVFRCKSHFKYTSSTQQNIVISKSCNNDAAEIRSFMTTSVGGGGKFEEVSVNAASAFFTNLIAKDAYVNMLTGSSFVITDEDGNVLSGMGNMTDSNGNKYYLWSGGQDADNATFKVFADGTMSAINGEFSGLVKSKKNVITKLNIEGFTEYIPDFFHNSRAHEFGNYESNIVGTGSAPSDVSAWVNCFRGILQFKNDKLGQNMLFYETPNSSEYIYQGSTILKYPQGYPSFDLANYIEDINPYGTYTYFNDDVIFNLPFFPNINSDYHTMSEMNNIFTVDNYRIWKYLDCCEKRESGQPTASDWQSINATSSDIVLIMGNDIDWQVYKLKWMGEMLEAAREMLGCKITIRACTQVSGRGYVFRGVCTDNQDREATITDLISDYEWSPDTTQETSITLECKEFTFVRSGSSNPTNGIAWFVSTANYGYYDRFTIGLPDITT